MRSPKVYEVGDTLTPAQERWIEVYLRTTGNETTKYIQAGREAGYGDSKTNLKTMGNQNKKKFAKIIEARRKEINDELKRDTIAELDEVYAFWSETFRDKKLKATDRLKASELLAKSRGAFVEKVEVKEVTTDWFIDEG